MISDNHASSNAIDSTHDAPQPLHRPISSEIGNNAFVDDLRENNLDESFAPRPPALPKRRLFIGTLLLIVGVVTFAIGLSNKDTIVVAIGALAFLPGAYNSYVFFMVYCLRRTEMFNQLEEEM